MLFSWCGHSSFSLFFCVRLTCAVVSFRLVCSVFLIEPSIYPSQLLRDTCEVCWSVSVAPQQSPDIQFTVDLIYADFSGVLPKVLLETIAGFIRNLCFGFTCRPPLGADWFFVPIWNICFQFPAHQRALTIDINLIATYGFVYIVNVILPHTFHNLI